MERVEHTGYHPKADSRGRVFQECKIAIEEKNVAYKQRINRPTRFKRLEYQRLWKIAHNICKNRK